MFWQKKYWALALLISACPNFTYATIIGFGDTVGGVNDCTSGAVNGCFVVTDSTTPPIPNPIVQNPNDGELLVWNELQNFTLTDALFVNRVADETLPFVTAVSGGFEIASGTVVSSHYAQWDPGSGSESRVDTALLFDSDIFAFLTSDSALFDSDYLGLPGFDYADFGLRGLESGDTTEFGTDLTRVDISWSASSPGDWTRVITAFSPAACDPATDPNQCEPPAPPTSVPSPGTLYLFALGILAMIACRTRGATPRLVRR